MTEEDILGCHWDLRWFVGGSVRPENGFTVAVQSMSALGGC